MQFFTPVSLPSPPFRLEPHSHVLVLGSCFAEHMGQHLIDTLPEGNVVVNPFGVVYGEHVLHDCLQHLLEGQASWSENNFFEDAQGLWHSWAHSGAFNAPTRSACVARCQSAFESSNSLLHKAQLLIVTLSTDRHYRLQEDDEAIVANCHKQPARLFREEACELDEQIARWRRLIGLLLQRHPQLQVLFTLSPYRYAKYGLHENQISKAKLLLLIDQLCRQYASCHYFPAYEIILDQLRDYRFYKPDMLHPSEQAIDYVWQQFSAWSFSPTLQEFSAQRSAILRDLQHRPLHPESAAHQHFLRRLEARLADFKQQWGVSPLGAQD